MKLSTVGIYTFYNTKQKFECAISKSSQIYDILYNKTECSNLLCHWCRHTFESEPVYLPIRKDALNRVLLKGYFCSFNCAKAFASGENIDSSLLFELYRLHFNLKAQRGLHLKAASPWQALKVNGGIQTIEEFRKDFDIIDKKIEYTEHPVVHHICQLKITNIEKIKTSNKVFDLENLKDTPVKPKKGRKPKVSAQKQSSSLGILSSYM